MTKKPESNDEDEIDLRDYLLTFKKHKWNISGISFAITLLSIITVFSLDPAYIASTSLLIESENANIVSIEEVYGISSTNREYFETQVQILNSRDLAEKVFNQLNLKEHREFLPDENEKSLFNPLKYLPIKNLSGVSSEVLTESQKNSALIEKFMKMVSISLVRNSQIIKVTCESKDPELTALIPNVLAKMYIESNLKAGSEMNQQATSLINERIGELKMNLDNSERVLQSFIEEEQLIDIQGVNSLAAKELDEITARLVEARRKRSESEVLYNQVNSLKGGDIDKIESIPAILNHSLIQNSYIVKAEADRKVSELSKRYGPKHPKMKSAMSEQQTVNNSLQRKMASIIRSIAKDYEVARAEESHLQRALNKTKAEVQGINKKEFRLSELRREVESNRSLYNVFLTRLKETNATSDMQSANARIVETAVIPNEPTKPKKSLIISIAFVLSLIMAAIIAVVSESLNNTLKHTQDVEDKLHVSVLGLVPKLNVKDGKESESLRYFEENKQSSFAESIRNVRTGVLLSAIDEKKKIVLVTSSIPKEGKSLTSVNLALALAQMGNVLLVDCDMRRPSILKAFELDKSDEGLSQFVAGNHQIDKCVHYQKEENIFVMPAGVLPPNPLELISSKRFRDGLKLLAMKYYHIVIDSPPILAVSDAVVLSTMVNSVIYVVKADNTPYQAARKGLSKLHNVNAPVTGVVLNQVGLSKNSSYDFYEGEYHGHYGYLGDE
ncbi:MAG: polysaccharide biosynthesis tyrosine autokinase [Gammaproteobacteria bacterium]|nr:polysaccharide biosynthesis tyrosine autokinase [Gammaproteobacteria bacterium]